MSQNAVLTRPEDAPMLFAPPASQEGAPPAAISVTADFAAWEQILLNEECLADAPPIPLEAMRRESLYGDRS